MHIGIHDAEAEHFGTVSKFPNYALMKLAAYLRGQGHGKDEDMMTNFDRITESPQALAKFLCWNDNSGEIEECAVENYETCFTLTVEKQYDIPYDKQTVNPLNDVLLWLQQEVKQCH